MYSEKERGWRIVVQFPPDAHGAVGKETLPDDTLGAAALTSTLRKHVAAFTDSCSQALL